MCGEAILPGLGSPPVVVSQTASLLFEEPRLVAAPEIPARDDGNRLTEVQSQKNNGLTGCFCTGSDSPRAAAERFHPVRVLCRHLVTEDGREPHFSRDILFLSPLHTERGSLKSNDIFRRSV